MLRSLPFLPEWYLLIVVLAVISLAGIGVTPLLFAVPALVVAVTIPLFEAAWSAAHAPLGKEVRTWRGRMGQRLVTTYLHLTQPAVRLAGRMRFGLTPWRRRGRRRLALPRPWTATIWSERWRPMTEWLAALADALTRRGGIPVNGGVSDRWDIEVRGGWLGGVRILASLEEHGGGRQMLNLRAWPRVARPAVGLALFFGGLTLVAAAYQSTAVCAVMAVFTVLVAARVIGDCMCAVGLCERAIRDLEP